MPKFPSSFARLTNSIPFSGLFRQLEEEMETVVQVLQPGPLGIIEHKFSIEEIREAKATVNRAIQNWRVNSTTDKNGYILKDYIDM